MHNRKKLYFTLLGLLFAVYVAVEILKPKDIDWKPDFSAHKKIPYGCYILKDLLPAIKPGATIRVNDESLYTALDTGIRSSCLLIITEDFAPDKPDIKALLQYIGRGNKALVAAINFGQSFADTLGFTTNFDLSPSQNIQKAVSLNFVNPRLRSQNGYAFMHLNPVYLSSFDTLKTTVIGRDSRHNTVFAGIKTGKGMLYLLTKPEVFTNYHLLYSSPDYAIKALSYLDSKNLIWDGYYKPERVIIQSQSPLRYILGQEPLRFAYFLGLFTLLLFIVSESRRRQRAIPVHNAPANASVEFVETISRLYLGQKDNADLARKKIQYFYDFIAITYYLQADESSEKFRKQFAEKTSLSPGVSEKLFDEIARIKQSDILSDKDLLNFVRMINHIQYQTTAYV